MSREKGRPKTGGRKKGTPNKVTGDLRTWITELLDKNRNQIEKDIKRLEPEKRVLMFEKLLNYVIPKMQSIDNQIDFTNLSNEQIEEIATNILKSVKDENNIE